MTTDMEDETKQTKPSLNGGPKIERSEKETKKYGKRIIFVFLLGVGAVILLINAQARFRPGGGAGEDAPKNYRTPPSAGFAELAASMRRDRRPVQVISPGVISRDAQNSGARRVIIEGRPETGKIAALHPAPRYYSNNDDAQLARTLRTMKAQAITARPVVENFNADESRETQASSIISGGSGATGRGINIDPAVIAALARQEEEYQDTNGQVRKQNFLRGADGGGSFTPQGYSANLPAPQQFPYEIKAGTIIPGLLISGINSDLPGNVIAQVSENVWDTATGRHVLIPKGTRILGVYDSEVSYGQRRVLLVWNRLVFPNGTTLNIAGTPGSDQAGYSGLSGRVNEHWGTMLKTALFASVFVAGAEMVYDNDSTGMSGTNKSPGDVAAESVAGSILDMSARIMNRAADIQPTITVRPGKKMAIFVQQDVVFPFPYEL